MYTPITNSATANMPNSEPITIPTTAPVERSSDCLSVTGGTVGVGIGVGIGVDDVTITSTTNKVAS